MSAARPAIASIDTYIARQPRPVQPILRKIRAGIRRAVPAAEETISYRIPAFRLHGIVVYFAAFREHIGVYPPLRGASASFLTTLAPYAGPKGNWIFPLSEPIPYGLIAKIATLRARQNLAKQARVRGRPRHAKLVARPPRKAPAARKKNA